LGLVRQTVTEARRIIADLRPTVLDDFGLALAIQHEVDELRADGWHVEYEQELRDDRLPVTLEIALYRVAPEALTNAHKHAGTDRVRLELRRLGNTVILNVEDRGRGFDPAPHRPGFCGDHRPLR
jgi:signal transduction histidine kinase